MIQAGDRLLSKKLGDWISEGITGKTGGRYSHIEPILNSAGHSLRATFPRCKVANIRDFFDGKHRVRIIRPVKPYTANELTAWAVRALEKDQSKYDIWSFVGHLLNKKKYEKASWWNCAELTLDSDHAAGRHLGLPLPLVTPQMYATLTDGGDGLLYTVIYEATRPGKEEYEELINSIE